MKSLILLIALTISLAACSRSEHADDHGHGHGDEHGHTEEDAIQRGPHQGRMLRDGPFALEVTIFETGVPPQYRLYAYRDDQPVPAQEVSATIDLFRLDGEKNRFTFRPEGDVLIGSGVVTEPHSFDVVVTAESGGKTHRWAYESYEGRTTIPAATAAAAGIETAIAGPATIHERIHLAGRVTLDANRFAEVRARFAGPVREVRVALGDTVQAGQTLAIVENRDTLRSFAVTAPFAGTVLARHTNVGDVANDQPLFEVADLSRLWVEFHAFGDTAARLASGQGVRVQATTGDLATETTMDRLLPLAHSASQTIVARALLPNPEGRWRPGMAVQGEITVASAPAALAVERIGLQPFRDFTVVFAKVGDTYEVRMLELGRQDDVHAEVLGGLKPGTEYVTAQSFLIKADIEKSGASHDH